MLNIKMVTPEILEVEEIIMSWEKDHKRYFYTNIETWEDCTNPSASKQTENFKPLGGKMTAVEIDWCKKHYFPKVGW